MTYCPMSDTRFSKTWIVLPSRTDPDEFVDRHLGEAFEGAAMLAPDIEGTMLDLGSGNGYPGIPLAAARPGLRLTLTDASARKAEFLRQTVRSCNLDWVDVYEAQIQPPTPSTSVR